MAQMTMAHDPIRIDTSQLPQAHTFFAVPEEHEGGQDGTSHREITIESLYMLRGEEPPTPQLLVPITPTQHDRMCYLYMNEYAAGMDSLFETTWYTQQGLEHLLQNQRYCIAFVGMLKLFEETKSDNYDQMRLLPLTESRMIWWLMTMPRSLAWTLNEPLLEEVTQRLDIFESLLTGKEYKPPPNQPQIRPQNGTLDYQRQLFWRELSNLASTHLIRKTVTNTPTAAATEVLSRLRNLLCGLESRDVLYSIAAVRHYGPHTKGEVLQRGSDVAVGGNLKEDERGRFAVAKKFVEDEAAGKGTNQVVQRACGMAVRSWTALQLW